MIIKSKNLNDIETINHVKEIEKYFPDSDIVLMPDYHGGKNTVVGLTMKVRDKISPYFIGNDIGCLDKDTEILTKNGWIKISEYYDEDILIYNKDNDTALFQKPLAYIKQPCDWFYHLKNNGGLDQVISEEHKILAWIGDKGRGFTLKDIKAQDFVNKHNSLKSGVYGGIKTTFNLQSNGINISDNDLRILIMISADGTIRTLKNGNKKIELHLKKERKILRAEKLLNDSNITYKKYIGKDNTVYILFNAKDIYSKTLSCLWNANQEQLKIVCDEVIHWDGSIINRTKGFNYSSTIKENADIIQFAFACNNRRCGIQKIINKNKNWNNIYQLHSTNNEIVYFPKGNKINTIPSVDGYKYCFTTSTGYFIIRRNNKISITGNCGMTTFVIEKSSIDFKKHLKTLDDIIHKHIPAGRNIHEDMYANGHLRISAYLKHKISKLNMPITPQMQETFIKSMGTLGGGNHFIELDEGEDNWYLTVHSGSRNLGACIFKYYKNLALKQHKEMVKDIIKTQIKDIEPKSREEFIKNKHEQYNIPDQFKCLTGGYYLQYLNDTDTARQYASYNRKTILTKILVELKKLFPEIKCYGMRESIHNYISLPYWGNGYDDMYRVLRKGAISADLDRHCIIPLNMRDGIIFGLGKGKSSWNYSAPHGAGRIMSRTEAYNIITLDEYKKSMQGIYSTCICADTIDESPMAYKNQHEILDMLGETITLLEIAKPIYNFKGV